MRRRCRRSNVPSINRNDDAPIHHVAGVRKGRATDLDLTRARCGAPPVPTKPDGETVNDDTACRVWPTTQTIE